MSISILFDTTKESRVDQLENNGSDQDINNISKEGNIDLLTAK